MQTVAAYFNHTFNDNIEPSHINVRGWNAMTIEPLDTVCGHKSQRLIDKAVDVYDLIDHHHYRHEFLNIIQETILLIYNG